MVKYRSWGYPKILPNHWGKDEKMLVKGWKIQSDIDEIKKAVESCDINHMLGMLSQAESDVQNTMRDINDSKMTIAVKSKFRNDVIRMHQEVARLTYGSKGFTVNCCCSKKVK